MRNVVLIGLVFVFGCANTHAHQTAAIENDAGGDVGNDTSPPLGYPESCNGIDDDFDGLVDEGCPVALTPVEEPVSEFQLFRGDVFWLSQGKLLRQTLGSQSAPETVLHWRVDGDRPEYRGMLRVSRDYFLLHDGSFCRAYRRPGFEESIWRTPVVSQHCDVGNSFIATSLDTNSAVWNEDFDVYLYNLTTQTEERKARGNDQQFVVLEGDVLAWVESAFDDDTAPWKMQPPVPAHEIWFTRLPAWEPQLAGQIDFAALVQDHEEILLVHDCAVSVFNTVTGIATSLVTSEQMCGAIPRDLSPKFAALQINGDVVLIGRDSNLIRQATTYRRLSYAPQLDGDWLVWLDDRNEGSQLFVMNLRDYDSGDFRPEGHAL